MAGDAHAPDADPPGGVGAAKAQDLGLFLAQGADTWREHLRRSTSVRSAQLTPAPQQPRNAAHEGEAMAPAEAANGAEESVTAPLLGPPSEQGRPLGQEQGQGPLSSSESIGRDFFKMLSSAPQSVLIHLLMQYHEELIQAGKQKEADTMAASLARLVLPRTQQKSLEELHGTDLLLQQGLLSFMLAISPYLPVPQAEIVKFRDLSLSIKRVVPKGIPSLGKQLAHLALGPFQAKPQVVQVPVLTEVSGYLMPGTSTLVLGPPGCGKSTLMKIISGRLSSPALQGQVLYNNLPMAEVLPRRLVGVADAEDFHLPFITIRETLEFARNCSQMWTYKDYGPELQEFFAEALALGQDPKIEMILSMMALKRIANRPAGSAVIPTTTPDERRRLTAAELMAGVYTVFLLDEVNEGVDPAVTYAFLEQLLMYVRVRQMSTMASVERPSPEVFRLFDRVLLLGRGRVLYQGHRLDVLPYFEQLGYVKPPSVETAEFLQEIASGEGGEYLPAGKEPLSIEALAAAYLKSDLHVDTMRIVDAPDLTQQVFVQASKPLGLRFEGALPPCVGEVPPYSQLHQVGPHQSAAVRDGDKVVAFATPSQPLLTSAAQVSSEDLRKKLDEGAAEAVATGIPLRLQLERPYEVPASVSSRNFAKEYLRPMGQETLELTRRMLVTSWRNKFGLYARLFQVVVLGLFTGSFFFQMSKYPVSGELNKRRGVVFLSLITMTLANLAQLPQHFDDRLVFYKHSALRFFRPASYWLASFVSAAVFSVAEATIWSVLVYFLSGLTTSDNGAHFFIFWGIIILISLHGSSLVRALGYLMPDRDAANAISGILIALFVLFAGFVCARLLIPPWWIWLYYINPLAQGVTALLVNEFSSSTFATPCSTIPKDNLSALPQCGQFPQSSVGNAWLQAGQFYSDPVYIAVGAAVIAAWVIVWNLVALLAMSRVRHRPPIDEGQGPQGMVPKRNESLDTVEAEAEDIAKGLAEGKGGEAHCSVPVPHLQMQPVPITLSWHQLGYEIRNPQSNVSQTVFQGVSGWGRPGQMVAVVGASRAGKTTLLNCLAGRYVQPDAILGQVLVNGAPKRQSAFSRSMGYVDRVDTYSPFMTVREALQFSAALRLGDECPREQREAFVDEIIDAMGLRPLGVGRLVGSLRGRMTKAQSKRVAIAAELAANPGVLFLDDPLSSLDSLAGLGLMRSLKQVAATGRLVITTARHITQRMGCLLDSILILKSGGRCVYFGPLGAQCKELQAYFEGIPGVPRCPPGTNPCTFALNVIGDGVGERVAVRDFEFEFQVSGLALRNAMALEEIRRAGAGGELGPEVVEEGYAAGYWTQFKELNHRIQRRYWRNLSYSFGRIMSAVIMGLLVGSLFWQENITTVAGMSARAGLIFASCLLVMVSNAQNVVVQVVQELPMFKRERATRQYHPSMYTVAWTFAEMTYLAVATLIFCAISCTMSGTATASAAIFFQYWFILYELVLAITFLGMLIAVAVPFPPAAAVLVSMLISLCIPTSGLVLARDGYVPEYIWLYWINPMQYALNAMTSIVFYCDTNSAQCLNSGLNPTCANNPAACPACPCPRLTDARNAFVWSTIETSRRLDHTNVGLFMGVLALYCLLFRALAFLAMAKLRHHTRY